MDKQNTKSERTKNGWAKVPHGIIDAALPNTLKLLLWLCYDRKSDWTFSVPEVARSLDRTPQCIRAYFRQFLDAGVFSRKGFYEDGRVKIPIYFFHRDKVKAFVSSQLKVHPETDPETDPETNPETNPETDVETDPETGVSHSENDLPRLNTEKNDIKTDDTENIGTKGVGSSSLNLGSQPSVNRVAPQSQADLADEFDRFFHSDDLQGSHSDPDSEGSANKCQENGSQPPSLSVAPGIIQAAAGDMASGLTSMTPAPSSDFTTIQLATGNTNNSGTDTAINKGCSPSASTIQRPASGNTKVLAAENNTGHSGASADLAAGNMAKHLTDSELEELAKEHGFTKEQIPELLT